MIMQRGIVVACRPVFHLSVMRCSSWKGWSNFLSDIHANKVGGKDLIHSWGIW